MKRLALLSGIGLLAVIWAGPLLAPSRGSFAAHMLSHMGVVAIAAPLLAVGTSGTRLDFCRALLPDRAGADRTAAFALPILASLVELMIVWAWHAPIMRSLVQATVLAAVIEQASFLAAGLFLWLACIGTGAKGSTHRGIAGAFGLLLTSIHMTLLGALLALAPRPLYGLTTTTCLGLELGPQEDQVLGGVIMLSIGAVVYLAGGVVLLGRAIQVHGREAAR